MTDILQDPVAEGRRFLTNGELTTARQYFERALSSAPDSLAALNGLAESCFGLGDLDSAERFAARAMQIAPADIETLNNAGVILFQRGDHTKAEQAFLRALNGDSNNTDSHTNLLAVYGQLATRRRLDTRQSQTLLSSVNRLTADNQSCSRPDLIAENHQLRDSVLREYLGKYEGTRERILLHRPANGALKYLMDSWAEVLNHMGIPTSMLTWGSSTREAFHSFRPTVFITVADPSYSAVLNEDFIARYRGERRLKVARIGVTHRIDPTDFVITFHLDPQNDPRFANVDKPLLSLPFGINPRRHYMRPGKEVWDFFFVGSNSHLKTDTTNQYLMPIVDRYRGILAGTNWQVGLGELTIAQAAPMYGMAKIYPNFHLPWQYETVDEINERAYIIPACGGFELVDNPAAMRTLYEPDEMAVAKSPAEYHDMFAHFLAHPEERTPYIARGMRRTYRRHTLFHILNRLAQHLAIKEKRSDNRLPQERPLALPSGGSAPSISAVLITYNRSHLLKRSLNALAEQNYPNLEVVVVDDCSTDDTPEVIESFKPRIRNLVHRRNEQNMGAITNRRIAASLATGEYIMMCADDDLLPAGALREFVKPLEERRYDLIYCDLQVIDENDQPGTVWRYRDYDDKWDLLRQLIEKGANVIPEAHLVRRDVFNRYWAEWYQKRCVGPTWIAALDSLRLHHVPKPLYQYRIHSDSTFKDATGLLSRNKGVTNFLNAIMFRHSPVELFQTGVGRPLRCAVGEAILNYVRHLLVHGGKFVEGTFYTGHRYKREDQLFAMYYETAWHWLELAKRFLDDGMTINRLQANIVKEVGHGYDPIEVNQMPRQFRQLPWFAYRPPHNFCDFVPFDMITLGESTVLSDDAYPILAKGKMDVRTLNTPVSLVKDIQTLMETHVYQIINIFDSSQREGLLEMLEDEAFHFTYVLDFTTNDHVVNRAVNYHAVGDSVPETFEQYLNLLDRVTGTSPWAARRRSLVLAGASA